MWPQYVRDRIRDTYLYFGASLPLTAAAAVGVFNTPVLRNIVMRQGWISLVVSIAAMIGSGAVARSIPYQEGFGAKQLAWMVHCGVVGAVIAPICVLGGPLLVRAAWYTAGMVGGLSTGERDRHVALPLGFHNVFRYSLAVAACAPSEKFLHMGGPLAMGLGVVLVSTIGSAFLPPTTALGAGMFSIAVYGGLILFGGFLLYDTQKIVHRSQHHPQYAVERYDPVSNSISIYMDTINIFIRIAQVLAMSNRRK